MQKKEIIIIGSGLVGLAAASYLNERGISSTEPRSTGAYLSGIREAEKILNEMNGKDSTLV